MTCDSHIAHTAWLPLLRLPCPELFGGCYSVAFGVLFVTLYMYLSKLNLFAVVTNLPLVASCFLGAWAKLGVTCSFPSPRQSGLKAMIYVLGEAWFFSIQLPRQNVVTCPLDHCSVFLFPGRWSHNKFGHCSSAPDLRRFSHQYLHHIWPRLHLQNHPNTTLLGKSRREASGRW